MYTSIYAICSLDIFDFAKVVAKQIRSLGITSQPGIGGNFWDLLGSVMTGQPNIPPAPRNKALLSAY